MNYGDHDETYNTHRRYDPPLRGRRPVPEGVVPTDQQRSVIQAVLAEHPTWGPIEIYEDLRMTRRDIPKEVVEVVVAEHEGLIPPR